MKYFAILSIISVFSSVSVGSITHTIDQKDKKFSQESIVVNIGDTIVFKNSDPFQHNVYSLSEGNSFELKIQKPGESSPVPLKKKKFKGGEMMVECAIHPTMKLKVKINGGDKKESTKKDSKKSAKK